MINDKEEEEMRAVRWDLALMIDKVRGQTIRK